MDVIDEHVVNPHIQVCRAEARAEEPKSGLDFESSLNFEVHSVRSSASIGLRYLPRSKLR